MEQELCDKVSELVEEATGQSFLPASLEARHGGCIHRAGVCSDGERRFFLKCNEAGAVASFAAEANGLMALREAGAIRVPQVIGHGVAGDQAVLVLEALDFARGAPAGGWRSMGAALARLHQTHGEFYGWEQDNFIGASPQLNRRSESWAEFFVGQRLKPQFEWAASKGHDVSAWQQWLKGVPDLLDGHEPQPSLLHGDLWSGNASFTAEGEPVIYDPAVYYGDRECDLAFTQFFGGFPPEFYRAYQEVHPLAPGHESRRDLYNLYHVLNHAVLFGGGYAAQARTMMQQLAA